MRDVEQLANVVHEYLSDVLTPLLKRLKALEDREPQVGKDGAPGKDGRDGADGTSVAAEDVLPALQKQVADYLQTIPMPENGKDGADGKDGQDGKSFTEDEVEAILQRKQAEWALDFERRAQDVLQKAIDRIPAPKDGKDGRDGLDGFDAFEIDQAKFDLQPDGRTLVIGFTRKQKPKDGSEPYDLSFTHEVKLATMLYRGVWQEGQTYERGDCVTWGGSLWHCEKDTGAKPETSDCWKLAVKRGRDGRDGEKPELPELQKLVGEYVRHELGKKP